MSTPDEYTSRRSAAVGSSSTPIQVSGSHHAPSIISSRMTDLASEDGEEYHAGRTTAAGAQSSHRASGGGPSAEPTRPASAISSQRETGDQAPPSRGGILSFGSATSWRTHNAFGGPGTNMSNTSRPQSAASRTSRTHIPSVTSHAFFRPMSSQRLQAQRGTRFTSVGPSISSDDKQSGTGPSITRHSQLLNMIAQPGPQGNDLPPPPSRGTDFTEQDTLDRASVNASPTGNATVQSIGESTRPLKKRSSNPRPTHLNLGQNYKQGSEGLSRTQKSPRSFKSNFLSSAKDDSPPRNAAQQQHQRLSSDASSPRFVHAKEPSQPKGPTGNNYQYFSGNTMFFLGGRLQNTRDRPINLATGILVVLPSILFFVYSAPYLWHGVSPAIPIFFAYIFFICISSFIHGSVTDPGILPRNLHPTFPPENAEDPLALGPPTTDWTIVKSAASETAAMEVPTKFCKTCNIWRPPRGHHCRICNNCIETQDHHCVWLNNCVGRRNYRYFFTFVSSGTVLGMFLIFASLGHCLGYQSTEDVTFRQAIDARRVPFALVIYGVLITPYPACLLGYHLFLMGRGETTREYLNSHKFLRKDRHRPFNQGNLMRNWIVVLMRPRPPTYLRFKAEYEEGDQRFGSRRARGQAQLVAEQKNSGMEMQTVSGAVPSFQGPATRVSKNQDKT